MFEREAHLKQLMLRGLDGDATAWRALLTEVRGALTAYYRRRMIGHEADVEDLVQECLIAIHAKRATFDRTLAFSAWAYAIARYKLIDHLRRQGRATVVPLEDHAVLLAPHTVEDGVVRRDLGRVLSILPARQRRLIEDVRLRGFSVAEAAARNGCTEGAAKVSVHRGMKALGARVAVHED
ncbi:sigma-70 family RNA polymerase sigma factor [Brevundimonas sp.]|uniref:sigma-70 family RNA polymerase sigma factor n=1 Tax=Brevundimonas sp. TaxID=1871086 RepID=UPI002C22F827|nr:sigma-70 family RNA polymerase sigma factor [Brevundimonas sp.]HWQ86511.1 sigma-70 family RNA polymerase sigma factor [Brevundimonas sp.]